MGKHLILASTIWVSVALATISNFGQDWKKPLTSEERSYFFEVSEKQKSGSGVKGEMMTTNKEINLRGLICPSGTFYYMSEEMLVVSADNSRKEMCRYGKYQFRGGAYFDTDEALTLKKIEYFGNPQEAPYQIDGYVFQYRTILFGQDEEVKRKIPDKLFREAKFLVTRNYVSGAGIVLLEDIRFRGTKIPIGTTVRFAKGYGGEHEDEDPVVLWNFSPNLGDSIKYQGFNCTDLKLGPDKRLEECTLADSITIDGVKIPRNSVVEIGYFADGKHAGISIRHPKGPEGGFTDGKRRIPSPLFIKDGKAVKDPKKL